MSEINNRPSTDMQTVVTYAADLIEADSKLEHNANDSGYDCDRLSPEEKINVEDDDKEYLVVDQVPESQTEVEARSAEVVESKEAEPSWHPHVYGKPPKKPTPHTIQYILGLAEEKKSVSPLMKVKRFDKTFQEKNQIQSDDKKVLSVHKNKLQEQLLQKVRTSGSDFEKVYFRCEEPLNLSVAKSKDSPGSSADDDKKGKLYCMQSKYYVVLLI